ncbi:MAG: DUF2259 domain-containing protein, partial [Spirochaetales bacterium]|nr:DUF2259 domain-containing protein [Spirochaetales bacterium]MCF7939544.1 DUF2259 domain-containing protein [Spirochaetales bacterium]
MKKSSIVIVVVLITALSIPAVAGDIASFVNLGFSRDGNYFLFGQYGVGDSDGKPYAELYTVDVSKNSFASSGVKKETYSIPVETGQEGSGALYTLLRESSPMIERYRVNHLLTGRPVYLLTNGEEPKSRIEFRDFPTDTSYTVTLVQDSKGKENNPSAAFHLQLRLNRLGKVRTYTIGRPD